MHGNYQIQTFGTVILHGNKNPSKSEITILLELAHEGHPGETVMKTYMPSRNSWEHCHQEQVLVVLYCYD